LKSTKSERKFSKVCKKEVAKDSSLFLQKAGTRTDFRDMFTVTIDGETARDFDDAISIIKKDDGFILYVHIADVSHFVRGGTNIDNEAYKRGTSIYFPEFAIPMLPEELSNELCSLKPDEERLAVTAEIFMIKVAIDLKVIITNQLSKVITGLPTIM